MRGEERGGEDERKEAGEERILCLLKGERREERRGTETRGRMRGRRMRRGDGRGREGGEEEREEGERKTGLTCLSLSTVFTTDITLLPSGFKLFQCTSEVPPQIQLYCEENDKLRQVPSRSLVGV